METEPHIIGIGGKLRSGKDTVSDHLVDKYGWVKMGMSDPLREATDKFTSVYVPEEGGSGWINVQGLLRRDGYVNAKENSAYRTFLQELGTEVGREMIGDNTWVDIAKRGAQAHLDAGKNVILTGIRFPNELEAIRSLGGETWWVSRPEVDDSAGSHASETSISHTDFDRHILNDGTLEDLYAKIDLMVGA